MSNNVNYETAWRFLKNIIEQLNESKTHDAQTPRMFSNVSEFDKAKGMAFMTAIILEQMERIEEGIADAMRGQEGDE